MRTATIIGGLIGIFGIIITVTLFALGECNDYVENYRQLTEISQQKEDDLTRLQSKVDQLVESIDGYKSVLVVSAQYIEYKNTREQMDSIALKAERAVALARERGGDHWEEIYYEKWKDILRQAGFSISSPLPQIVMNWLSQSQIARLTPVEMFLSNPSHAETLAADAQKWIGESDLRDTKMSILRNLEQAVSSAGGAGNARVGNGLEDLFRQRISTAEQQKGQVHIEYEKTLSDHKRTQESINEFEVPWYCFFSELKPAR